MASQTDSEVNGYTFMWKIENVSHCWLKMGEELESPILIATKLGKTQWSFSLYLKGKVYENRVMLFLHRNEDCNAPYDMNYQLAFLDKDGSILNETTEFMLSSDRWSVPVIEQREKMFVTKKEEFLPEDTLTVQCTIWKKGTTPVEPRRAFARTVFKVNKRIFEWKIDNFSTLKPGVRNIFKDDLIKFGLVINETADFFKKLDIEIISFDATIKYFSFKTTLIDWEGKNDCRDSSILEYFTDDFKVGTLTTLTCTKYVMQNKNRYLPNGDLLLNCEYVSSNGNFFEDISCGIIYPEGTNKVAGKKSGSCVEIKPQNAEVLVNDLKAMYIDGSFSDTELRTSTKTFPAHKNILSARSAVFRRMFSSDMKEKNNGPVYITDLEDDTVHQMLLYIYTDTLDNQSFENARNLYLAANEYEMLSLRNSCSSFLKDNMCPTKACDVLILADRYKDDDLKSAVQDYIHKHDKEIFHLPEWEDLINTNFKLAVAIMYRKIDPRKIQISRWNRTT